MDSENMDIDDSTVFVPRPKRFKVFICPSYRAISDPIFLQHQSYQQTLKEVHLPSAFQQSHLEHEVGVRPRSIFSYSFSNGTIGQ